MLKSTTFSGQSLEMLEKLVFSKMEKLQIYLIRLDILWLKKNID